MKVSKFFEINPGCGAKMLHIGCGSKYLKGWCNIDYYPFVEGENHRGSSIHPDVWLDLKSEDLGHGFADLIYSSHVIEHFTYNDCLNVLRKCFDALSEGGFFVAEMPDLENLCIFYAIFKSEGPRARGSSYHSIISSQFYGASWEDASCEFSHHKYVWSKNEFCRTCRSIGFNVLLLSNKTLSHYPGRDFVIVCQKPNPLRVEVNKVAREWVKRYGHPLLAPLMSVFSTLRLFGDLFAGICMAKLKLIVAWRGSVSC